VTITVLLADDEQMTRAGLAALLRAEPDLTVVAEAGDGRAAVDAALRLRPQVVVMDLKMPVLDGVAATRELAADRAGEPVGVLVLSGFHDDDLVQGALRAGASGYLLKHAAPNDLAAAVRAVADGAAWIDPAVAGAVLAALRAGTTASPSREILTRLTTREREVLVCVARGSTNDEIARQLFVTVATVRTHVSRVLMKSGSRSRAEAVALAYESGLVVPGVASP
jgi:DNA-binding NarL/FixJ family response regulator